MSARAPGTSRQHAHDPSVSRASRACRHDIEQSMSSAAAHEETSLQAARHIEVHRTGPALAPPLPPVSLTPQTLTRFSKR
jgi:hypothetical protein